jgi:hypothetical protein
MGGAVSSVAAPPCCLRPRLLPQSMPPRPVAFALLSQEVPNGVRAGHGHDECVRMGVERVVVGGDVGIGGGAPSHPMAVCLVEGLHDGRLGESEAVGRCAAGARVLCIEGFALVS